MLKNSLSKHTREKVPISVVAVTGVLSIRPIFLQMTMNFKQNIKSYLQSNALPLNFFGDHFAIYGNIKSLLCTPETNIMSYVNYTSFFKKSYLKN